MWNISLYIKNIKQTKTNYTLAHTQIRAYFPFPPPFSVVNSLHGYFLVLPLHPAPSFPLPIYGPRDEELYNPWPWNRCDDFFS